MMQKNAQADAWLAVASDASATPERRIGAANALVCRGHFAEVEPELRVLAGVPPIAQQARRLLAVVAQLMRWGIVGAVEHYTREGITFDSDSSVLVARRPGADKIVFVFTGNAKQFWVSIHLFHQLLPQDCHIVYLRDPRRVGHIFGLEALGSGYLGTLAGLQDLRDELGGPDVYCIGNSHGGYASLRYGLDLDARGVLAIVPCTDWSMMRSKGWRAIIPEALRDALMPPDAPMSMLPPGALDLATLYAEARTPPPATIVFGDACETDAAQARRMAGLPGVTLEGLAEYGTHDIVAELIATGRIRDFIDGLMAC